jgi:hypothetical protein
LAGLVLQQQHLGGVDSSTAISLPFGEAATQATSLSMAIGASVFFPFVLCDVVIGFAIIPDLGIHCFGPSRVRFSVLSLVYRRLRGCLYNIAIENLLDKVQVLRLDLLFVFQLLILLSSSCSIFISIMSFARPPPLTSTPELLHVVG